MVLTVCSTCVIVLVVVFKDVDLPEIAVEYQLIEP